MTSMPETETERAQDAKIKRHSKYAKVKKIFSKHHHHRHDDHDLVEKNEIKEIGDLHRPPQRALEGNDKLPQRRLTRTHSKQRFLCSSLPPSASTPHPNMETPLSTPLPPQERPSLNRAPSVKKHRQRGSGLVKIFKKKLRRNNRARQSVQEVMAGNIGGLLTDEEQQQLMHTRTGSEIPSDSQTAAHPLNGSAPAQQTPQQPNLTYNDYYPYTNTHTNGVDTAWDGCSVSVPLPPSTTERPSNIRHHQKRRTGTIVASSITGTPGWGTKGLLLDSTFTDRKIAPKSGYRKTIIGKDQSNHAALSSPPPPRRGPLLESLPSSSSSSLQSCQTFKSDKLYQETLTKKVCFSFMDDVVDQDEDDNEEENNGGYLSHITSKIPALPNLASLKQPTKWASVKDVCPPARNIVGDPRWQIFDIFRSLRPINYTDGSSTSLRFSEIRVASERSVESKAIEEFATQFHDSESLLPPERRRDCSLDAEVILRRKGRLNRLDGPLPSATRSILSKRADSFSHEDDDLRSDEDWEGEYWQKCESLVNLSGPSNLRSDRRQLPHNDIQNKRSNTNKNQMSFFTVWRPTSADAIHKLMDGVAVGKALNVKGKSAKRGRLSGYVPFVQIHEDDHIKKCCTASRDSNVRIYFKSERGRTQAVNKLEVVLENMLSECALAWDTLRQRDDASWETVDEEEHEDDDEDDPVSQPWMTYIDNQPPRQPHASEASKLIDSTTINEINSKATMDFENSCNTDYFSARSNEEGELEEDQQLGQEMSDRTNYLSGLMEEDLDLDDERKSSSSILPPPPPPPPLIKPQTPGRLSNYNSEEDKIEEALAIIEKWDMVEPKVVLLDQCRDTFGIEIPERLFWETYVRSGNIKRKAGSDLDTGRLSEPAFMDMNTHAIRDGEKEGVPRAVIWQEDDEHPLDPRTLLVAYEEEFRVKPVASDFDAFLIGTRGVKFAPLESDQMEVLQWQVKQIKRLLDNKPSCKCWTSQWLDTLKEESDKGFHPQPPPYGYGDKVSYNIVDKAVWKLRNTGAVRHGPESFNFYFPQEIDSHFLVVSDHFGAVPWMYLSASDLRDFLKMRIEEGFVFPMNVKWALCDSGWYDLWKDLLKSEACRQAMNSWFPPESGLREEIEAIHKAHPEGFVRLKEPASPIDGNVGDVDAESGEYLDPDIAALELKRYITLQRVKRKMRVILCLMGKI